MKVFSIGENEAGQRFDKYLKKLLSEANSGFIYKMLRKKNIVLNGKKSDGTEKLAVGDEVKLFLADDTFEKFRARTPKAATPKAAPAGGGSPQLEIVYEDADILVINKPVGMLSQKATPQDVSANEYILSYLLSTGAVKEEELLTFKPSVCNRLDRNTSGLLLAGKTLKGLQTLSKALKERSAQKYYRCIVAGELTEKTYLKGYLSKDEVTNKVTIYKEKPVNTEVLPVETEYEPLSYKNGFTELEVHLITGRSHQIRAHLASIGHPILGDMKYGDKKINETLGRELHVKAQLLHAYRIHFEDGLEVIAPPPKHYEKVWKQITK